MCRFYWGDDYVQDDITSLGENVSVHFVEVLDKLRRVINDINGLPLVVEAYANNVDGICIQALYEELEAQKRNIRKNPAFGKLVEVEQAEIQRTREALDKAGQALLNKLAAESGMTVVVSRQISSTKNIIPTKETQGHQLIFHSAMENVESSWSPVVEQAEPTVDYQSVTQPVVINDVSTLRDLSAKQTENVDGEQKISGRADISGDSSGALVTDDLNTADEMSAISMTEEDQRQILEELENLWRATL